MIFCSVIYKFKLVGISFCLAHYQKMECANDFGSCGGEPSAACASVGLAGEAGHISSASMDASQHSQMPLLGRLFLDQDFDGDWLLCDTISLERHSLNGEDFDLEFTDDGQEAVLQQRKNTNN